MAHLHPLSLAANTPCGFTSSPLDELISNRVDQLIGDADLPLEYFGLAKELYEAGLQDAATPLGVLMQFRKDTL